MVSMNFKIFLLTTSICFCIISASAQLIPITLAKDNGSLYILGGLNRSWFLPTDIRYSGSGYDFTLQSVKGEDNWQPYQFKDWSAHSPQLSFRMGYLFSSPSFIGIELGYDYVNYSAIRNQMVHEKGRINGEIIDKDTVMGTPDLSYGHANGSGLLTLNFVKGFQLVASRDDDHVLSALLKAGGGVALPRTDIALSGIQTVNDSYISGYVIDLEVAVNYVLIRHIVIEISARGNYVDYTNALTISGDHASHTLLSVQCFATIGYQFKL
jgi:hypothetical protein